MAKSGIAAHVRDRVVILTTPVIAVIANLAVPVQTIWSGMEANVLISLNVDAQMLKVPYTLTETHGMLDNVQNVSAGMAWKFAPKDATLQKRSVKLKAKYSKMMISMIASVASVCPQYLCAFMMESNDL